MGGYFRRQGYGTHSGFIMCCDCNTLGTLYCVCDPGLLTCNLFEVITQRKKQRAFGTWVCNKD